MTTAQSKLADLRDNYDYANNFWGDYITATDIHTRGASGRTWSQDERRKLADEGREPIEFNITRRPLQFFSGYLRDNINQVVYSPFEGSDDETCEQFSKLSYDIWNRNNGFNTFLNYCDEGIKSGISLVGIHMDYSKDFVNGDIGFWGRCYNQFYLDPTFSKIDLSDCSFAMMRDVTTKQVVSGLLDFIDPEEINKIAGTFVDDKFLKSHPQSSFFSRNPDSVAYDQHYVRKSRMREMLVDRKTGFFRDITDESKEKKDKLKFGLSRLHEMRRDPDIDDSQVPDVEIKRVSRPYVELNIFLNGELMYEGDDKTGITSTFPFVPIICYLEPSIWDPSLRIQGIASTNYSINREFNKRHIKAFDMMDSVISTGYAYMIGSLPNPDDLLQAGQNKAIGIDPENAPMGIDSVLKELRGGGIDPTVLEYQKILDQLSLTLANVTESAMGIDEGGNTQISGRLAQVRIAQGLRGNRSIFDNIEDAQKILGEMILEAIQKNYPPEKVERILNEEPTQQFYDGTFEQYDAVVKEAARSASQKDAHYYELVNLKRDGIVDVPESAIIEAYSGVAPKELKDAIEQREEQKAEQQKKIEAQEIAALELANSQAEANLALSAERRGRILADIGLAEERISESMENRSQAALAKAKTITEIASLEDDRILKVLDFVNMLQVQEMKDREQIGNKVEAQADEIEATKLTDQKQESPDLQ